MSHDICQCLNGGKEMSRNLKCVACQNRKLVGNQVDILKLADEPYQTSRTLNINIHFLVFGASTGLAFFRVTEILL